MKWTHFLFSSVLAVLSSQLQQFFPRSLIPSTPHWSWPCYTLSRGELPKKQGLGLLWSSYVTQGSGVSSDEDLCWSLILQPQHMLLKWATGSVCHVWGHRLTSSACFWSPSLSCSLVHSPLRCPVALAYNLVCCVSRMLIFCHRPWDRLFCC